MGGTRKRRIKENFFPSIKTKNKQDI